MKEVQNMVHVAISHCPLLLSDRSLFLGMMSRCPLSHRSSRYYILPLFQSTKSTKPVLRCSKSHCFIFIPNRPYEWWNLQHVTEPALTFSTHLSASSLIIMNMDQIISLTRLLQPFHLHHVLIIGPLLIPSDIILRHLSQFRLPPICLPKRDVR